QNYLIDERGWDLTDWETLDNSTTQRPNRTDHTFQWKRKDWSLEDSEVRLSVTIQGDQIGSYGYWFKVPEAFMREYRKTRNIARFWDTNTTSVLNNGALIMAALFYLIALARGKLNWRSGLTPALIVFGVSLLSQWNTLPLAKNYYSTTENYGLFWLQEFFDTFYFAFIRAVPIYFLWAGGQQIAKRVWPQKDMILARHSNRLATFTQAYWRGIMLGGLSMIYLVGFYFIAIHGFNAWSPLDVNYSNLFSTPLPFMSSLRNGILPGIGEELEARLVWVGTLLLVVRYRWLALVIPGGLWAFAHVGNYVSEPFYLRGIELWLPAFFLYGLFFLRFGLVTVMVGHCVYNSLLGALLLIKTEDAYLVGSGILVIGLLLLPLLPGLWQWWRRPHGFKDSAWELVPAMPEDYDQILSLPLGAATLPKQLESEDGLPRDYEIICLKGPMGVVGVSIAHVDSDRATLQQVYVKPRFRRCYYGSRLVDGLVKQLRQRGVRRVNVVAKTASTTEKRFWANQNWKPVSNTWQIGG
ncbi:MAG: GNAT family N-acetyltransferase, partial [Cyanobacteria bacterium P01_C01_bin.118]